ncbi:sigma factor-like helix-turn-helix DNA-binding protein [Sutcliffiella horikoshii]|uniref:sigma factor-like helix-turn-helix DNA-binding protein n=1 Tax=Sutcliffiella horikoshii TaxID=79883 RepID=UPI001F1AF536|nr:sigma factor-like helix-turn-helix DNA-binding protein [Sutcliffiella horikoshii]MCG1020851.1 RNA polymerase subunit sigma [Sutcliffiella horikoshii]
MKNAEGDHGNLTFCYQDEELNETYQNLLRYCLFLTKNEWDGSDLAQEAITKTIQHYSNSAVISNQLLKKIAYNQWIDIVRKRQNELLQDVPDEQTSTNPHVEKAIITTEVLLTNMTPKQAIIFFLKEAFDYQALEIANLLGTTEGAIKSSLHRSRKRLKNEETTKSDFVENFWNEKEREIIPVLFQESLREEDPSPLIKALPTLFAFVSKDLDKPQSLSTPPPINVFKCAA